MPDDLRPRTYWRALITLRTRQPASLRGVRAWLRLLLVACGASLICAGVLALLVLAATALAHLPWEPESVLMACLLAVLVVALLREWWRHKADEDR